MAKWSPTTLLRELQDFQDTAKFGDDATVGDVKDHLQDAIVEKALADSRRDRPGKKGKDDDGS